MSGDDDTDGGDQRQPWMRFYTTDWRADPGLRAVGYAARGLWMDMLSLMHEAVPYGHLVAAGRPVDAARLAARLGGTVREVQRLLDQLEAEGVFSRTPEGVIYSRRMVRDAQAAERARSYGRRGGNPQLRKASDGENRPNGRDSEPSPDKGQDKGDPKGGVNPPHKARAHAYQMPEARITSSLRSDGGLPPAARSPPSDARGVLWGEGLPRLRRLTGKPDKPARALLGRLLRDADDDCALVSSLLHEAEVGRMTDPVAWLSRAIAVRTGRGAVPGAPPERRRRRLFPDFLLPRDDDDDGDGAVVDGTAETIQ